MQSRRFTSKPPRLGCFQELFDVKILNFITCEPNSLFLKGFCLRLELDASKKAVTFFTGNGSKFIPDERSSPNRLPSNGQWSCCPPIETSDQKIIRRSKFFLHSRRRKTGLHVQRDEAVGSKVSGLYSSFEKEIFDYLGRWIIFEFYLRSIKKIKLVYRIQWGLKFQTRSEFGWSIVVRFSPNHSKTEPWLA